MTSTAHADRSPYRARALTAPRRSGAHRRARARRPFTAAQLQAWGLREDAVAQAVELQKQGYQVETASNAEAAIYQTGAVGGDWVLLGVLPERLVFAVSDN